MCLILFSVPSFYNAADDCFTLAANRDEFYARPTRPMGFWSAPPHILAGKDLEGGGTWFGVNPTGRFAAVTNYRNPGQTKPHAPSRGELIPALLTFEGPILAYLKNLDSRATRYSGFNLLAGEAKGPVFWYSNQTRTPVQIPPGIHGLSNHLLDTPWPKVLKGKSGLKTSLTKAPWDTQSLFALLSDTCKPADSRLPDTGVGREWERLLSPLFIESPTYGTRSSTLMRINRQGDIRVIERTWGPGRTVEQDLKFTIASAGAQSTKEYR